MTSGGIAVNPDSIGTLCSWMSTVVFSHVDVLKISESIQDEIHYR